MAATTLSDEMRRVQEARHHDPFAVLGRHPHGDGTVVRAFAPGALELAIEGLHGELPMHRVEGSDLFEWRGSDTLLPRRYRLVRRDARPAAQYSYDPYCFAPQLGEMDLYLFNEGTHRHAYRFLGAHCHSVDGVDGVLFATWAPNAERVSVVGDFNQWDGRCHPMRSRGGGGVWELFIPGLEPGTLYKFELRSREGAVLLKADPYGRRFELRPATAALVEGPVRYEWGDREWLAARERRDWLHAPLSIYEVHLGSWQRDADGGFLPYRLLAERLVDYVQRMGFTHIELLPVTEHPFDGSWGYQTTGYFAATSRHGDPDGLRYLIDLCHRHGIGVILDWVPAHFPKDAHALARFDGTPLYEHEDPRRGEHRDWGTLIFNFGRSEVKAFLIASAVYWFEEFHIDGVRVDAVASMLYLDYSRSHGDWVPNRHGGRENLEAIAFLRELNTALHGLFPGALTIAEESTAWPMVSRPPDQGGLGFSMKWNMGWMNDTLNYFHKDPLHRCHHHNLLTFGLMYAFSENFVLPFSHDEVVHMKRSLLDKMPGGDRQRFANLRLLYSYLFTIPGKKLLFMGGEIAQGHEWNHDTALEWELLHYPHHTGMQRLVEDLNRLYRTCPPLHRFDFEAAGFEWLDCDDRQRSILAYLRRDGGDLVVAVLNFTPMPRDDYCLGVPAAGDYEVIFNSDSSFYDGGDRGPHGRIASTVGPCMGRAQRIEFPLPPLSAILLRYAGAAPGGERTL